MALVCLCRGNFYWPPHTTILFCSIFLDKIVLDTLKSRYHRSAPLGIYCEIIKDILLKHRSISAIKIACFSFVIKKRHHLCGSIYRGNNKVDLVLKFLSQVSGLFDDLCDQLPYIFQAIDLLVQDGFCEAHEGELICVVTNATKAMDYDAFIEAAIQESKLYSDRQFLREVISIV